MSADDEDGRSTSEPAAETETFEVAEYARIQDYAEKLPQGWRIFRQHCSLAFALNNSLIVVATVRAPWRKIVLYSTKAPAVAVRDSPATFDIVDQLDNRG